MATIALTTANALEVLDVPDGGKTLVAAANLSAGTFVREDTSGNWIQALATSAANAKGARLLAHTVKTGEAGTAYRTGIFAGFTISQAFNVDLFIADDGTLADAAGTVSIVVGRVRAADGNTLDAAHDKIVSLDAPL